MTDTQNTAGQQESFWDLDQDDEDTLALRRDLYSAITGTISSRMDRIIEDLADDLTLHHRRSTDVAATKHGTQAALLEHVKTAQTAQTPLQALMAKKTAKKKTVVKKFDASSFENRIDTLGKEAGFNDNERYLLTREVKHRAFKHAIQRADRSFFLMKENF